MFSLQAAVLALALGGGPETVLYDFCADWCGPCRQMDPVVKQLAAQGYPVRKVNIDHDRELATRFGVQGIPCFVLVVDGQEVDRAVGMTSGEALRAMFTRAQVASAEDQAVRGQSPDPFARGPAVPSAQSETL
jgi:thioredoxin-like negative regulator of GroEL